MEKLKSILKSVQDFLRPTDIFASQRPLFLMSFLLGIFPMNLAGTEGKRRLEVTICGCIITGLYGLMFAVCYIITLIRHESLTGYFFQSDIANIGNTLTLCTAFMTLAVTFVCCIVRRFKLIAVYNMLAKVDGKLKDLGVEIDYVSTLKFTGIAVATFILIYGFYLGGSFWLLETSNVFPNFAVWMTFFLPHAMTSMVAIMFMCIVKQIRLRIRCLNVVLTNLCQTYMNGVASKGSINYIKSKRLVGMNASFFIIEKDVISVLDEACRIHEDLCDTCFITEQYFAVQMLTIVSIAFLVIVFNSYYVLEVILGNGQYNKSIGDKEFVIFFIYQMCMYTLAVLIIVQSSHSAVVENEKCSIFVHKLLNIFTELEVKEKLMQFSIQLLHRKVRFTAFGLFSIDRTLIFTITGATTTYLIILVQFTISNALKSSMCQ
ncbi:putative gustatory receptor 28b [Pseudolycoriella hygida]|uniref:Gustatory receptor n=1 Tax=Pseudolycoriella hygida TaxID=35572 RepID=A0A9Q0MZD1_9DIPT|nr:putative gustatory receptor 28b [Pseudolycoriella hygida]